MYVCSLMELQYSTIVTTLVLPYSTVCLGQTFNWPSENQHNGTSDHLLLACIVRAVAWAKTLGGQFTHCLHRAPPSFSMWCMYDLEISREQLPPCPPQAKALIVYDFVVSPPLNGLFWNLEKKTPLLYVVWIPRDWSTVECLDPDYILWIIECCMQNETMTSGPHVCGI